MWVFAWLFCLLVYMFASCADCCGLRFSLFVTVVLILVFRLLVDISVNNVVMGDSWI